MIEQQLIEIVKGLAGVAQRQQMQIEGLFRFSSGLINALSGKSETGETPAADPALERARREIADLEKLFGNGADTGGAE